MIRDKSYFRLFPYSQGVVTAGSSAYLILTDFCSSAFVFLEQSAFICHCMAYNNISSEAKRGDSQHVGGNW